MAIVLLAIVDAAHRCALAAALERRHVPLPAGTEAEAAQIIARQHIDVAFIDGSMSGSGRLSEALRRTQAVPRPFMVRVLPAGATLIEGEGVAGSARRPDASVQATITGTQALALVERLVPQRSSALPA